MKQTRLMMGMPITVEIVKSGVSPRAIEQVFTYFQRIDDTFSTYKQTSEIMNINQKKLVEKDWSEDMKLIFALAEQTKQETSGYFDIQKDGFFDPSGIVKGWAIYKAGQKLHKHGLTHFYIDAGGDIQTAGLNSKREKWRVGIRNPFNRQEYIKIVALSGEGIATSGTYIRGEHIYNPHDSAADLSEVASITVIARNVYDADRFATAAFAMGEKGISFIENLPGCEGYMVKSNKKAIFTSGFEKYVC